MSCRCRSAQSPAHLRIPARRALPVETDRGRIASKGFAPDKDKMLDLTETAGLFEHFEVNPQPFWPVISRLLGGSLILHAVLAAGIILIPPVRDALSIAVMFRGAGFAD